MSGIQTPHPEPTLQGDDETVTSLTVTGLTASRLVATDGSKTLGSVANLASWIAGTANQVTVSDDGDGTITLSLPQDIHTAATPTFAGLTVSGLTLGSVPFAGAGGLISQDNAALFWDNTSAVKKLKLRQVTTSSGFDLGYRTTGDGFVNAGSATVENQPYVKLIGKNANEQFVLSSYDFGHTISFRNSNQAVEYHGWDNTV